MARGCRRFLCSGPAWPASGRNRPPRDLGILADLLGRRHGCAVEPLASPAPRRWIGRKRVQFRVLADSSDECGARGPVLHHPRVRVPSVAAGNQNAFLSGRVLVEPADGGGARRRSASWLLSSMIHSTVSPRSNSMAWATAEGNPMYHCRLLLRLMSWTFVGKPMAGTSFQDLVISLDTGTTKKQKSKGNIHLARLKKTFYPVRAKGEEQDSSCQSCESCLFSSILEPHALRAIRRRLAVATSIARKSVKPISVSISRVSLSV